MNYKNFERKFRLFFFFNSPLGFLFLSSALTNILVYTILPFPLFPLILQRLFLPPPFFHLLLPPSYSLPPPTLLQCPQKKFRDRSLLLFFLSMLLVFLSAQQSLASSSFLNFCVQFNSFYYFFFVSKFYRSNGLISVAKFVLPNLMRVFLSNRRQSNFFEIL